MTGLLIGETFTEPTGDGQSDTLELNNWEGRGARHSIGTLRRFLSNSLPEVWWQPKHRLMSRQVWVALDWLVGWLPTG